MSVYTSPLPLCIPLSFPSRFAQAPRALDAQGCTPFWSSGAFGERPVEHFVHGNFPRGAYAVPDPDGHKSGAYFVQGRGKFFFFFCDESRGVKAVKIPGDVVNGEFEAGAPCDQLAPSIL